MHTCVRMNFSSLPYRSIVSQHSSDNWQCITDISFCKKCLCLLCCTLTVFFSTCTLLALQDCNTGKTLDMGGHGRTKTKEFSTQSDRAMAWTWEVYQMGDDFSSKVTLTGTLCPTVWKSLAAWNVHSSVGNGITSPHWLHLANAPLISVDTNDSDDRKGAEDGDC